MVPDETIEGVTRFGDAFNRSLCHIRFQTRCWILIFERRYLMFGRLGILHRPKSKYSNTLRCGSRKLAQRPSDPSLLDIGRVCPPMRSLEKLFIKRQIAYD